MLHESLSIFAGAVSLIDEGSLPSAWISYFLRRRIGIAYYRDLARKFLAQPNEPDVAANLDQ